MREFVAQAPARLVEIAPEDHRQRDGWTLGSYLGWRFALGLRFDAAAAYSGIGYDGTAGTYAFDIEPSAKLYALWERENVYTGSLGILQADRAFCTGRNWGIDFCRKRDPHFRP